MLAPVLSRPGKRCRLQVGSRPTRPIADLPQPPVRLASRGAVREVRPGVWHWEARHPEWNERQWWGPLVSSYAIDDGTRLVLFDPLAPPAEIEKLVGEREAAVGLTCPW